MSLLSFFRRKKSTGSSTSLLDDADGLGDAESAKGSGGASHERVGVWQDAYGQLASRALQTLLLLALTATVLYLFSKISNIITPVFLALIIASAYSPIIKSLKRKGFSSLWAAITALAVSLAVFTGLGWAITKNVQGQWDKLAAKVEDGFWELVDWVSTVPYAPSTEQWEKWQADATAFLTSSQFGVGAVAGMREVFHVVTALIILLFILFFFLKDGPIIWQFLTRPFTGEKLARANRIGHKAVSTLGLYVRGTATVAAVDAVGIYIGLLILGVPLALPLAVLVFFFAFIPFIGATLAGVLAALVALVTNGPGNMLAVIILVVAVNQLEGHFLQPIVMGRTLKLHPLVVLITLAIGTMTSGILGALLAVPIVAVLWSVILVWNGERRPAEWAREKSEAEQATGEIDIQESALDEEDLTPPAPPKVVTPENTDTGVIIIKSSN